MGKQFRGGMFAAIFLAALLQGCGTSTVSQRVNDEGQASELVFPSVEKNTWMKEGTYASLENLRKLRPGMPKEQLYDLLGRPHFAEGMYGVREWDYLFNFRTGDGEASARCQFKVLFDREGRARNFHWLPQECAARLKVPQAAAERVPPRVVRLQADGLFAFGKSGPQDLLPEGRQRIDELAAELRGKDAATQRLLVTGHTDRLGSPVFNAALSMARAETVRDYLSAASGLPVSQFEVQGRGAAVPVVQCAQTEPTQMLPPPQREALIACLAPNRRVEIEVQGATR